MRDFLLSCQLLHFIQEDVHLKLGAQVLQPPIAKWFSVDKPNSQEWNTPQNYTEVTEQQMVHVLHYTTIVNLIHCIRKQHTKDTKQQLIHLILSFFCMAINQYYTFSTTICTLTGDWIQGLSVTYTGPLMMRAIMTFMSAIYSCRSG